MVATAGLTRPDLSLAGLAASATASVPWWLASKFRLIRKLWVLKTFFWGGGQGVKFQGVYLNLLKVMFCS